MSDIDYGWLFAVQIVAIVINVVILVIEYWRNT